MMICSRPPLSSSMPTLPRTLTPPRPDAKYCLMPSKPQIIPPLVTGEDLLAFGIKPGPALGTLLTEIRDKQLGEELKSREEALAWLQRRLAEPGESREP